MSPELAEDVALVSQMGGGNATICQELSLYQTPTLAKSPLDTKAESILKMAATAMQPFGKVTWVRLLESDPKKPRDSILSHLADVQAYGDAELAGRAGSWTFGLTNAKPFFRWKITCPLCQYAVGMLVDI